MLISPKAKTLKRETTTLYWTRHEGIGLGPYYTHDFCGLQIAFDRDVGYWKLIDSQDGSGHGQFLDPKDACVAGNGMMFKALA